MILKITGRSKCLHNETISYIQRSLKQFVTIPIAADLKFLPQASLKKFENSYEMVTDDILSNKLVTGLPEVNGILKNVLDYNVPDGRKIRASLIIAAYQLMNGKKKLSMEEMKKLHILGWSYEMMISAYIIQDDIVDNSPKRRGKATWYKCVGMNAINDSIVLEAAAEKLIEKHFSENNIYQNLLKYFLDMRRIARVGQLLETSTKSLNEFTEERYDQIAYNKMGHCTFEAPIRLASVFAGKEDLMASEEAQKIIRELGFLYTVMNDFLDCYGEIYFRKLGTDIQESRCTWLIITALKKASAEQKKILEDCHGSYDQEKLSQVKKVYEELEIYKTYEDAERNLYRKIGSLLGNLRNEEAHNVFNAIIKIVFRRSDN